MERYTGRRHTRQISRAQAMVEFALIAPLVLVGLLVGIQFAVLGAGELAIDQAAYQGARYASLNSSAAKTDVQTALNPVVSPIIKAGYSVNSVTPTATPRTTGTAVTVTINWNASSLIFLPNPFFYGINFPTSLSATESAFTE